MQGLRRGYEVSGDESRWSCLSPSGRDVSARRNLPATRAGNTSFRGGAMVMGAPRFICPILWESRDRRKFSKKLQVCNWGLVGALQAKITVRAT